MNKLSAALGWAILFVLATGIAVYAFYYFTWLAGPSPDAEAIGIPAQFRDRPLWFFAHVFGGGAALLLMPWQFLTPLRNRKHKLHRVTGRLYVSAIAIGGTAGFYIAINSDAGPIAQSGFATLAILWLTTTSIALFHAVRRNIPSHRRWMIRSAALTFAAVTLRLYMGVAAGILSPKYGIEISTAYVAIAWLCWVPNLIVAEMWLNRGSRRGLVLAGAAAD